MNGSIALAALLLGGCVTYNADVQPTAGAPKLSAQSRAAEITRTKPEGMLELAHLHVTAANGSANDCDRHLAEAAAKLGATVAYIHDERGEGGHGGAAECYGFALAPR